MEIDFEKLMAGKSEEDLHKYITDSTRYTPEAIRAANTELKKRGIVISESELARIDVEVKKKENDSQSMLGETVVHDPEKNKRIGIILVIMLWVYIILAYIFHWPILDRYAKNGYFIP